MKAAWEKFGMKILVIALVGIAVALVVNIVMDSNKSINQRKADLEAASSVENATSTSIKDDGHLVIQTEKTKSVMNDPVFQSAEWKTLEMLNEQWWQIEGVKELDRLRDLSNGIHAASLRSHTEALVQGYKASLESGVQVSSDKTDMKRAVLVNAQEACVSGDPAKFISEWTVNSVKPPLELRLNQTDTSDQRVVTAFKSAISVGVQKLCPSA